MAFTQVLILSCMLAYLAQALVIVKRDAPLANNYLPPRSSAQSAPFPIYGAPARFAAPQPQPPAFQHSSAPAQPSAPVHQPQQAPHAAVFHESRSIPQSAPPSNQYGTPFFHSAAQSQAAAPVQQAPQSPPPQPSTQYGTPFFHSAPVPQPQSHSAPAPSTQYVNPFERASQPAPAPVSFHQASAPSHHAPAPPHQAPAPAPGPAPAPAQAAQSALPAASRSVPFSPVPSHSVQLSQPIPQHQPAAVQLSQIHSQPGSQSAGHGSFGRSSADASGQNYASNGGYAF